MQYQFEEMKRKSFLKDNTTTPDKEAIEEKGKSTPHQNKDQMTKLKK